MSDPYRQVTITEAEYQQLLADRELLEGMRITDEERCLLRWMLIRILDERLGPFLSDCGAEVFVPCSQGSFVCTPPLKRTVLDMIDRLQGIREPINAIPIHQNRVQPEASTGPEPEPGVPASPDR